MKRVLVAIAVTAFLATFFVATAGSVEQELTYSIVDNPDQLGQTRAYAYKISITPEVIQAAGAPNQFGITKPCDPATDKYNCQYNHVPNCAADRKKYFEATPPVGEAKTGGAGFRNERASAREPENASPIKINDLQTNANLSNAGSVLGSGGQASDTFIDHSGAQNKEAHTESNAFVSNKPEFEERCFTQEGSSGYVHVVSRSGQKPETYHLSECFEDSCSRSGILSAPRPSAKRAYSIVDLREDKGKVYGKLKGFVSSMTMGSGTQSLSVESMTTYISFESDGTRSGLKWTAISAASGVTLGGIPINLKPGDTVSDPTGQVYVGIVGPFISASDDGKNLFMIAPGLFYSTSQQTTYVAGAQVRATFGRAIPFSFLSSSFGSSSLGLIRPGPSTFGSEVPSDLGTTAAPAESTPAEPPVLSIKRLATRPWPFTSLAIFAVVTLGVILAGWVQRFRWGRRIYTLQPFRSFNWMYRAFVRT